VDLLLRVKVVQTLQDLLQHGGDLGLVKGTRPQLHTLLLLLLFFRSFIVLNWINTTHQVQRGPSTQVLHDDPELTALRGGHSIRGNQ